MLQLAVVMSVMVQCYGDDGRPQGQINQRLPSGEAISVSCSEAGVAMLGKEKWLSGDGGKGDCVPLPRQTTCP